MNRIVLPILPDKADLPPADRGKIACIGSGPSSLGCAVSLRKKGFSVTVFESLPKAGGCLTYAVPEYKLPQSETDRFLAQVTELGIEIKTSTPFCTKFNAKKIEKAGFQAVFLGLGLWETKQLHLSGANLDGVYDSTAFLALTKLGGLNVANTDSVVVAGAGNSAVTAAVVAKLKGAKAVTLIAKSPLSEFTAVREDLSLALGLGISFIYDAEIKKIAGRDGRATTVRARSVDDLSEFSINATKVVFAYGRRFSKPNAGCSLMLSDNKQIQTQDFATDKAGYFSGGDAVRGSCSIDQAFDDGRQAAEKIDRYIQAL